jgi:hypothetical protein
MKKNKTLGEVPPVIILAIQTRLTRTGEVLATSQAEISLHGVFFACARAIARVTMGLDIASSSERLSLPSSGLSDPT